MTDGIEYISPPVSGAGASGDHGDLTGLGDDDHPQYETSAEAAAKVTTHAAVTTSIHGITDTSALATSSSVTSAVSTHAGLADPHTGYLLESLLDAKGDLIAASADNTPARLAAGTNGYGLLADSTQPAGVKWGIAPWVKTIRPKSGLYYVGTEGGIAGVAWPLGYMATSPIVWAGGSIDRIGIQVTIVGTAGNVVRLGIYSDDGTGYPGALLLDAGTVAGDAVAVPEITISQSLPPGLYHLVACPQGVTTAPTVRASTSTGAGNFIIGSASATGISNTNACGYDQGPGITGALPANWSTTVSAAGNSPRVFVRAV